MPSSPIPPAADPTRGMPTDMFAIDSETDATVSGVDPRCCPGARPDSGVWAGEAEGWCTDMPPGEREERAEEWAIGVEWEWCECCEAADVDMVAARDVETPRPPRTPRGSANMTCEQIRQRITSSTHQTWDGMKQARERCISQHDLGSQQTWDGIKHIHVHDRAARSQGQLNRPNGDDVIARPQRSWWI